MTLMNREGILYRMTMSHDCGKYSSFVITLSRTQRQLLYEMLPDDAQFFITRIPKPIRSELFRETRDKIEKFVISTGPDVQLMCA